MALFAFELSLFDVFVSSSGGTSTRLKMIRANQVVKPPVRLRTTSHKKFVMHMFPQTSLSCNPMQQYAVKKSHQSYCYCQLSKITVTYFKHPHRFKGTGYI